MNMVATKQAPKRDTKAARNSAGANVHVQGAGVEYTLLTEDQRTLKGRLLNSFGSRPESARFWALRDVSFEIGSSEVVGIVGRNGSGKSTLLKVLSRVITPTEGTVRVSGNIHPILELGAALNVDLTGRENVLLNGALMRMDRQQVEALIPQILAFSELGTFFDLPVKTYSSGMTARLSFSMATQITPEILILDEVLAVGDEQFQRKCVARMRKLMDSGSIVILVSHNSSIIEQLCNRALYLVNGNLVDDGRPRDVLARYRAEGERG
jgi:ABC-type polysaccharide/polyol phosphate transport system ATPase subunit